MRRSGVEGWSRASATKDGHCVVCVDGVSIISYIGEKKEKEN